MVGAGRSISRLVPTGTVGLLMIAVEGRDVRRELGEGIEHIAEIGVASLRRIGVPTGEEYDIGASHTFVHKLKKCMRPAVTSRTTSSPTPVDARDAPPPPPAEGTAPASSTAAPTPPPGGEETAASF